MGYALRYFKIKLLAWSEVNSRTFPWRRAKDPYKICVAEIMLHQTFARKVVPVYKNFLKRYPDIKRLSRAKVSYIEKLIHPLGLIYRARLFKELAKYILKEFNGRFPSNKDALLSIPGVGEYTASAILCFAYEKQVPIIDANVIRVYSRYFGLNTKLPNSAPSKQMLEIATKALPKGKARDFNYALLDFAAIVCTHYNPKCATCPVRRKCLYALHPH